MSFGDFTYRLFHRSLKHYIPWPGGRLSKRNVLVEDLKPALKLVNREYGYDEEIGGYAPMEVWVLNPKGKVVRTYLIHELLGEGRIWRGVPKVATA